MILNLPSLNAHIPAWLEENHLPGLSLAYIEDAQVGWSGAYGFRRLPDRMPVTPETIFEAASETKPQFALLAMQMVEAGLLDLDAPLTRYTPEPYLPGDPNLEEITARRVLCHTSSLPNWNPDKATLHTHFPPGDHFSYSGEGYVYLQQVVERLAGQSLAALGRARLLDPLGMVHYSFTWEERFEGEVAFGHDPQGQPRENQRELAEQEFRANAAHSLYSTPSDLARSMCALLGAPGPRILSQQRIAEMLTPQVKANDLAPWDDERWPNGPYQECEDVFWGLGWGIQRADGEEAFFHWGDNFNFHTFAIAFRQRRTGLVAMTNAEGGSRCWMPLFSTVFGGELPALRWLNTFYS